MATTFRTAVFFSVLISLFFSSYAQTCSTYKFSNTTRSFSSCADLPVLNSFLHWNAPSSGSIQIAYRHTGVTSSNWVAWAINPNASGMIGAQSLVAYQQTNGIMRVYKSPVTSFGTQLQEGDLSFSVSNLSTQYENSEMIIFATVAITTTTVNQVWQMGPLSGGLPASHATTGANTQSAGSINFLSGAATAGGGNSRIRRRNVHGVLTAISWGTLMPLGVIIARYLKVFKSANPAWFYLHVTCQCSAYIIGVAGWGTGLKLGSDSTTVQYDAHRNIGITLFVLGTLQVFALLLRPNKDNKYRLYWNIYHHSIGYLVIILSIVNIFKGFDILEPEKKWKKAYIGILIALGFNAVLLECYTWYIVLKRKRSSSEKSHHGVNGANGVNGYGARPGI